MRPPYREVIFPRTSGNRSRTIILGPRAAHRPRGRSRWRISRPPSRPRPASGRVEVRGLGPFVPW